jgi:hypothetical protein
MRNNAPGFCLRHTGARAARAATIRLPPFLEALDAARCIFAVGQLSPAEHNNAAISLVDQSKDRPPK